LSRKKTTKNNRDLSPTHRLTKETLLQNAKGEEGTGFKDDVSAPAVQGKCLFCKVRLPLWFRK